MTRKKKETDVQTNGTAEPQAAVAEIPMAEPVVPPPPPDTHPDAPKPVNIGQVVRVFSYPVKEDTKVQAIVYEKVVKGRDGRTFNVHEVTVRRIWTNQNGDEKTFFNFRGSELYALAHAIERAERYILDLREETECPF